MQHTVTKDQEGLTLINYLAKVLDLSKKRAKSLIDERNTFVNQRRVWMAKHRLHAGDVVELPVEDKRRPKHKTTEFIYEDDFLAVVDKQPGIFSNGEKSLEEQLARDTGNPDLAAVHRLDRDTSGCLVLAKTTEAFELLTAIFRQREVSKQYHAIVIGHFDADSRRINKSLEGQPAVTHIRTLDSNKQASHLLVRIETGRTHQIRKHLTALGYPIVGDRNYGTRRKSTAKAISIGRQMLHATSVSFRHPITKEIVRAKSPLPRDFRSCLKRYELS